MLVIIGIDLGTTNSLAAVWRDGASVLIPNAFGEFLTPSVVGLDDDGRVLVGRPARDRLLSHPDRTVAAFKRYMGSARTTQLGGSEFRPEELSALVLRALRDDAEAFLGQPVSEAIVTVPAYFSDPQRKATRMAGRLAGLRVERLLNEPTAAALAYGLHLSVPETRFLIFDLGGGTFDVSVLEIFDGVMEVRASAGDNFLGGEDFVDCLIELFRERSGQGTAPAADPEWGLLPDLRRGRRELARARRDQHLRNQAERAKRELSGAHQATISSGAGAEDCAVIVTRAAFEEAARPLLERLMLPVERALRDARLDAAALDSVVLVGGATRMPMVRRTVGRMFGRLPASDINPDEVVARGAAVQAGLKARDAALEDVMMTDVCPYTLGIEVAQRIDGVRVDGGAYHPLIERNAVIPVSRADTFFTVRDDQQQIEVRVFQGESMKTADNIHVGDLTIAVPRRPAGQVPISVRFTYDVDGLLEVEVEVVTTGDKKSLVLEGTPGALSAAEIQQRLHKLAALKIHPRDQLPVRSLMTRAGRMYEEQLGETRATIAELTRQFKAVLERQDPREVAAAVEQFERYLDELDGMRYL